MSACLRSLSCVYVSVAQLFVMLVRACVCMWEGGGGGVRHPYR